MEGDPREAWGSPTLAPGPLQLSQYHAPYAAALTLSGTRFCRSTSPRTLQSAWRRGGTIDEHTLPSPEIAAGAQTGVKTVRPSCCGSLDSVLKPKVIGAKDVRCSPLTELEELFPLNSAATLSLSLSLSLTARVSSSWCALSDASSQIVREATGVWY